VYLDGETTTLRLRRQPVTMAVVVAVVRRADGTSEVLDADAGPSEDCAFWAGFLRRLVARGLENAAIVTADGFDALWTRLLPPVSEP
jgi:transposase-like protein